ncbi:hypothetical protein M3936_03795 [Sutcliffiella horikoshii]|uniref:hypothetical protein n=1 Tax=Sutcliffiella horikoshii TaxID=79883 RepID=UPI00203C31CA|nr:hypothetical protein [Sutcliffiella horikoshii]MCM3616700.1 hypothetical protein [Sutcliffiella horikoshii]
MTLYNFNEFKENKINKNRPLTRNEQLFYVLMRDDELKLAPLRVDSYEEDVVVDYIKRNYPTKYTKAVKIVDDPKRKVMSFYEDDILHFKQQKEQVEWENEGYFNLINEYIEDRGLRKDFLKFISELKKSNHQDGLLYFGDLDWHLTNFE